VTVDIRKTLLDAAKDGGVELGGRFLNLFFDFSLDLLHRLETAPIDLAQGDDHSGGEPESQHA